MDVHNNALNRTRAAIARAREDDPRYSAPPCLSDLHGEDRKAALVERHRVHTARYLDRFVHMAAASQEPASHLIAIVVAVAVAFAAGVVCLAL